jgi:hypothetical protein
VEPVIKVEKFLMKQGIRVGKGAIEFQGAGCLEGFHLVGFTICDDPQKGMFVMFPMAKTGAGDMSKGKGESRNFFFLRPDKPERLDNLQDQILDVFISLSANEFKNSPRIKTAEAPLSI